MDTLPVTLIVKASGAEYEDHTVKCELTWTIRRLKGHLSEVYPCKPEEQKLIYSGQLLQDAVVLKDVLRQYDGQETHTVHLVYTPKQQQQNKSRSSMDNKETSVSGSSSSAGDSSSSSAAANGGTGDGHSGLRRRNIGGSSTSTPSSSSQSSPGIITPPAVAAAASPQQQQMMMMMGGHYPTMPLNNLQASALYSNFPANNNNFTATSEQIANSMMVAYQQRYLQYVNQYMAYMNSIQQQHQIPVQWTTVPSFNPGLQFQQYLQQQQQQPLGASATATVGGPGTEENVAPAAAADPAPQQPRFPLLVHEPDQPEPDWLDRVNMVCRVSLLLAMIYFYSSALRFAIVMCAILAIVLYRNRVTLLRNNRRPAAVQAVAGGPVQPAVVAPVPAVVAAGQGENEAVNLNEENNPVAAPPAPVGDRPANPDNNNNVDVANRNAAAEATNGQEQNNPTTVLSFLRTFVTSFFYSLLPEPAMAP